MDNIKQVENYLNRLECSHNQEKIGAATHVLELLGYDVRYDLISNKYKVVKGGC